MQIRIRVDMCDQGGLALLVGPLDVAVDGRLRD